MYQAEPELVTDATAIWTQEKVERLMASLTAMVAKAKQIQNYEQLDPLCAYFRFRTARDNRGIIEITGGVGNCFAEGLR